MLSFVYMLVACPIFFVIYIGLLYRWLVGPRQSKYLSREASERLIALIADSALSSADPDTAKRPPRECWDDEEMNAW